MAGSRLTKRSLANRYTLLVAVLVTATTLILAAALASGVYGMALREETARQRAQSDLVVRDVSSRLQASYRALRTLTDQDVIRSGDSLPAGKALASAYVENAEYLEEVALIDLDTTSSVMYPPNAALPTQDKLRGADVSQGVAYLWIEPTSTAPGSLWVVIPVRLSNGHDALLLGAARSGFIDEALKQVTFAEQRPTALIVDSSMRSIFTAGDPQAYLGSLITYQAASSEPSRGDVRIVSGDGQTFTGVYASIPGLAGLNWRVVIAEASSTVANETWQALKPAVFVWSGSSVIALLLALASVTFVARPLRLLNERARAAAAGEILEPLPVTRDDEIGHLIDSFNSVALRLNRMHDMTQLLASSSDLDEVLDRILVSLSHILGACDAEIFLLEDEGRSLRLVRGAGLLAGAVGTVIPTSGSPWLERAIDSGDIERFSGDSASDVLVGLHGRASLAPGGLAIPLARGARILGIVAIVWDSQRVFTEAETEVARSFAAQASVALDNARLFDEERRSRRDAEALRRVAEIMGVSSTLRQALSSIAAIEAELLGANAHWVFLDPDNPDERSDDALSGGWFALWRRLHAERGLDEGALPVSLSESDPDTEVSDLIDALGMQTVVVTPISVRERLQGLMVLGWSGRAYELDRHGIDLGSAIGAQVALALENAMLFDEVRDRADDLEMIFRISQAVSSSLQSKVVLNRVLDVVQKLLSADAVMLMALDPQRGVMVVPMARGILNPEMLQMEFHSGVDLPGEVFKSKAPVSVPDLADSASRLAEIAAMQALGSAVLVPLLARGRSIGVLAVFSRMTDAFSARDIALLSTFATQAALAIDTANLFSREHHVATVLQESIRPAQLASIEGIEAASVYVSAEGESEIGGDYYDLFVAPDGRVVLAIGDVCGKGVEAATKTSMVKYSIRGMIAAGASPSAVLTELNTALVSVGDPSSIVTLWLGMLDLTTGELSWANGGHPPAMLLLPSNGEIVRMGTTGALLGAIRLAEYGESQVVVEPGGTMLLYTDGVTEARNGDRFFGEGRVRRALRQGGSAAAVTQRMLSLVQRFSHDELRDDAAILTVRFKPPNP
ncbi:MAG: SpoIIE family protein phosphatase [Actinomycetia bacterium]|nr:SpoIIE family protein phosphatase [Actinomycetes bacterium]